MRAYLLECLRTYWLRSHNLVLKLMLMGDTIFTSVQLYGVSGSIQCILVTY